MALVILARKGCMGFLPGTTSATHTQGARMHLKQKIAPMEVDVVARVRGEYYSLRYRVDPDGYAHLLAVYDDDADDWGAVPEWMHSANLADAERRAEQDVLEQRGLSYRDYIEGYGDHMHNARRGD